jgi:hypothetical protein
VKGASAEKRYGPGLSGSESHGVPRAIGGGSGPDDLWGLVAGRPRDIAGVGGVAAGGTLARPAVAAAVAVGIEAMDTLGTPPTPPPNTPPASYKDE